MKNLLIALLLITSLVFAACEPFEATPDTDDQDNGQVDDQKDKDQIDEDDLEAQFEAQGLIIDSPEADEMVQFPLVIEGEARGPWFFEASFMVELLDSNGDSLATTIVEAQEDWMQEDFVDFEGEISSANPTTDTGTLVFRKANASGLPENDLSLELPVRFN